jgi:hypothetical protein
MVRVVSSFSSVLGSSFCLSSYKASSAFSPVGAALAAVIAVVSYSQGRGVARWAVTAAGLLVISGLTGLIEFWIQNGTAGVQ